MPRHALVHRPGLAGPRSFPQFDGPRLGNGENLHRLYFDSNLRYGTPQPVSPQRRAVGSNNAEVDQPPTGYEGITSPLASHSRHRELLRQFAVCERGTLQLFLALRMNITRTAGVWIRNRCRRTGNTYLLLSAESTKGSASAFSPPCTFCLTSKAA